MGRMTVSRRYPGERADARLLEQIRLRASALGYTMTVHQEGYHWQFRSGDLFVHAYPTTHRIRAVSGGERKVHPGFTSGMRISSDSVEQFARTVLDALKEGGR